MKKKGSLELSVNAIVILILAIGLLGLGLGFIKFMFDKTTGQLKDINKDVEKKMIEDLQESADRISMDQDNIEIKQGKSKDVYFGLRNELDARKTFVINGGGSFDIVSEPGKWLGNSVINCYNMIGTVGSNLKTTNDKANAIYFETVGSQSIGEGDIFVGKLIVRAKGTAPTTTYNCAIVIAIPGSPNLEYARKDFIVTVTR
jgi:hypothetical protein